MSKRVMTVLGAIQPNDLGITHIHEHLIVDMYSLKKNPVYIDNVLDNVDLMVQELAAFTAAGGRTVVEVTNVSLGQDPLALQHIAARSGVHVIAATGYYTEVYYTPDVYTKTVDEMAEGMIRDIQRGINGTGIKAGIIGEIATIGVEHTVSPTEEKVFRAAGRAHRATGVAITTHTRLGHLAQEQLDILEDEGVDLSRVIIGHQDGKCHEPAYHEAIARRGAYVAFDCIGLEDYSPTLNLPLPNNHDRVRAIVHLINQGYVSQIVLSSDICKKPHLHHYGGWGFDHLLLTFVPMLLEAGVSQADIHTMLVENPRRVLPF